MTKSQFFKNLFWSITSVLILFVGYWGFDYYLAYTNSKTEIDIVLPNGFTGPVIIVLRQEDGEDPLKEDNNLVFKIPSDGLLKTSYSSHFSQYKVNYFYSIYGGENGEEKRINMHVLKEGQLVSRANPFISCVYEGQNGYGFYPNSDDPISLSNYRFFVNPANGTVECIEVDSLFESLIYNSISAE